MTAIVIGALTIKVTNSIYGAMTGTVILFFSEYIQEITGHCHRDHYQGFYSPFENLNPFEHPNSFQDINPFEDHHRLKTLTRLKTLIRLKICTRLDMQL